MFGGPARMFPRAPLCLSTGLLSYAVLTIAKRFFVEKESVEIWVNSGGGGLV